MKAVAEGGIGIKNTETESEMEDPDYLISRLETDPSSNMIQAIRDGVIQPTHSLFELKMQILNGKESSEQTFGAPSSEAGRQFSVHPMCHAP